MKELYELKGKGHSIRGMARELGNSRNTVRRYVRSTEVPKARSRTKRGWKLDPYSGYIDERLSEGLDDYVVVLGEIRELGYGGRYPTLTSYVRPRRCPGQPKATVRFETVPGEQAQVDWGVFSYIAENGRRRRIWGLVMVRDFSRAIHVELVRRAEVVPFIRCHFNAFECFGGIPRRCLYDPPRRTKVVVLRRDDKGRHKWNSRMLDFARRVGFDPRLCRPYRAQTKGMAESGVKCVRNNFWPSARFADDADLNRQALEWCDLVASERVHGTTGKATRMMLEVERSSLGVLPDRSGMGMSLRDDPEVGRGVVWSTVDLGREHRAGWAERRHGGDMVWR